jgi:hypothetical protein
MTFKLREKGRLKVFENRILMRILRTKRDVNVEWGRLLDKELHSLNRSSNVVRVIIDDYDRQII